MILKNLYNHNVLQDIYIFHKSTYICDSFLQPMSAQVSALEQERSSLTAQLQREQTRVQELHAQHESIMDKSQKLQRELRQAQQSLLQVIFFGAITDTAHITPQLLDLSSYLVYGE